MQFRYVAYTPNGDRLYTMPRPITGQIGDVFGTRGTLQLSYSQHDRQAMQLPTFLEVAAEVRFDGDWEEIGPRYLRLSGNHEDTDQSKIRNLDFVGVDWLLEKARVGTGTTELVDGKRPFLSATPGKIMDTLMIEAKNRGAIQGIEWDFTATKDSAGVAWDKILTIYYSPGLSLQAVIENLVDQGVMDYRMQGRTLQMYVSDTAMGRDLTTGGKPVQIWGGITEAPVKYSLENLVNNALLLGDEGFTYEVNNADAPTGYGRLEASVEQGGVSDQGTAALLVQQTMEQGSRETMEITRSQNAAGAKCLPYRDYLVGDYVLTRTEAGWQRYRVREIQITHDKDGATVHTVLNDRLQELLLRLATRTNGIVGGSGSGGDGTRPAPVPPENDTRKPKSPEGLVVETSMYTDTAGYNQGLSTATWGVVNQAEDGTSIDLTGYELWQRAQVSGAWWFKVVDTTETSGSVSPLPLLENLEPAKYEYRVRAAASNGQVSEWSPVVTVAMPADTTAPQKPSAPTLTTVFRTITAEWDGLSFDGTQWPKDFDHINIYLSSSTDMADKTLGGSLPRKGTWTSSTLPADVVVYVAFTAVDTAGNESDVSETANTTPKKLIDDGDLQDKFEEIQDEIDSIVVTASGNVIHNSTTDPVAADTDKDGDLWQKWTTLGNGRKLVGAWGYTDGAWVAQSLDETYIPKLNLGTGTYGEMDGDRITAHSIKVNQLLISALTNNVSDPNWLRPLGETWQSQTWASVSAYDLDSSKNVLAIQGAGATRNLYNLPQGNTVAAAPGDVFRITCLVRSSKALAAGAVQISAMFKTASGQSFQYVSAPALTATDGSSPDDFILISGLLTAPDGAQSVGIACRASTSVPTGTAVYFMSPTLTLGAGATLIGPDSVDTPNLKANAVTADKFAGGTFIGKNFIGSNFATQEEDNRGIKINPTGFYSYNTTGDQTVKIDPDTGEMYATGSFYSGVLGKARVIMLSDLDPENTDTYIHSGIRLGLDQTNKKGEVFIATNRPEWDPDSGGEYLGINGVIDGNGKRSSIQLGKDASIGTYGEINLDVFGSNTMALHMSPGAHSLENGKGSLVTTISDSGQVSVSSGNNVGIQGSSATLNIGADSKARIWSMSIYNRTYTSSGTTLPMLITDQGTIGRESSSRRFKLDEQIIHPDSYADSLLSIDYKSWIDKQQYDDQQKSIVYRELVPVGPLPPSMGEFPDSGDVLRRAIGAIAEDFEDAGLDEFVSRDSSGRASGLAYDRIGVALIPIVRSIRDRLAALEKQIGAA